MSNNIQESPVKFEKKKISYDEFEKKVQIEMEHLIYFDRLKKEEAEREAKQYISSRFLIG